VLEKFGPRVSKFNSNGGLVKRWGKKGAAPGEFDAPEAICVDKEGNVYVADTGNNRVQKFDANGKFLMEIK
jgi:DNA-binding beta-propeller fold protein YncE